MGYASDDIKCHFANTSGTAVLTSASQKFSAITMNGVGGTVQQADDLDITAVATGTLTITNGIFDANTHLTTAGAIVATANNTRSLVLGSEVSLVAMSPILQQFGIFQTQAL